MLRPHNPRLTIVLLAMGYTLHATSAVATPPWGINVPSPSTTSSICEDLGGQLFQQTGQKDKCFFVPDAEYDAIDAKWHCNTRGGQLAEIYSQHENDFVYNMVHTKTDNFYIGLRMQNGDQIYHDIQWWEWNTGQRARFFAWGKGEPNNYNNREHCVVMEGGLPYWNDVDCDSTKRFICQIMAKESVELTTTPDEQRKCSALEGLWINDKCLFVPRDLKRTYFDAESVCEEGGGHLAAILSQEESDRATELFQKSGAGRLWFGLNDGDNEGNFVWTSGDRFNYNAWSHGEPNNYPTGYTGGEDCAQMWRSGSEWNDAACWFLLPFMCQAKRGSKWLKIQTPGDRLMDTMTNDHKKQALSFFSLTQPEIGYPATGVLESCYGIYFPFRAPDGRIIYHTLQSNPFGESGNCFVAQIDGIWVMSLSFDSSPQRDFVQDLLNNESAVLEELRESDTFHLTSSAASSIVDAVFPAYFKRNNFDGSVFINDIAGGPCGDLVFESRNRFLVNGYDYYFGAFYDLDNTRYPYAAKCIAARNFLGQWIRDVRAVLEHESSLSEWGLCARPGETCWRCPVGGTMRFGDGTTWYQTHFSGNTMCDNSHFPFLTEEESATYWCECLRQQPVELHKPWEHCADEGGVCKCDGEMRYGKDGLYTEYDVSRSTPCSKDVLEIPLLLHHGYLFDADTAPLSCECKAKREFHHCANEGRACQCRGTARYGNDNSWSYFEASGSFTCAQSHSSVPSNAIAAGTKTCQCSHSPDEIPVWGSYGYLSNTETVGEITTNLADAFKGDSGIFSTGLDVSFNMTMTFTGAETNPFAIWKASGYHEAHLDSLLGAAITFAGGIGARALPALCIGTFVFNGTIRHGYPVFENKDSTEFYRVFDAENLDFKVCTISKNTRGPGWVMERADDDRKAVMEDADPFSTRSDSIAERVTGWAYDYVSISVSIRVPELTLEQQVASTCAGAYRVEPGAVVNGYPVFVKENGNVDCFLAKSQCDANLGWAMSSGPHPRGDIASSWCPGYKLLSNGDDDILNGWAPYFSQATIKGPWRINIGSDITERYRDILTPLWE